MTVYQRSGLVMIVFLVICGMGGSSCHLTGIQPSAVQTVLPEDPVLQEAERAYQEGRWDEAIDLYAQQADHYPDKEGTDLALIRSAGILQAQGEWREALDAARRLIRNFPRSPYVGEAYLILSRHLMAQGYVQEAASALEQADRRVHWEEGRLEIAALKAQLAEREGRWAEALDRRAELYRRVGEDRRAEVADSIKTLLAFLSQEEIQAVSRKYRSGEVGGILLSETCRRFMRHEDWKGAGACLREFLSAFPDHAFAAEAERMLAQVIRREGTETRRVGCVLPLSGPLGDYGRRVLNGMLLALQAFYPEMKHERIPRLLIRDTQGSPEITELMVRALVEEEQVLAVIGPIGGSTARAAGQAAQDLGVPIITMTQAEGIPDIGGYVFRNFITAALQVKTLVQYAYLARGIERFAILYPDTEYGSRFRELFRQEVHSHLLGITAEASYDADTVDFSDAVRRLIGVERWARHSWMVKGWRGKGSPPPLQVDFQAVFVPDDYGRLVLIAPQLAYHDMEQVVLLGTNLWNTPVLVQKAGRYLQKAVFVGDFFPDTRKEVMAAFVESYRKAFQEEPDFFAAQGYDSMNILMSLLDTDPVPNRTELKDLLGDGRRFPGLTGWTSFHRNGEVEKDFQLLTVRDNRIVPVE